MSIDRRHAWRPTTPCGVEQCGDCRCVAAATVRLLARSGSGRSWSVLSCDAHRADSAAAVRELPGFDLVEIQPLGLVEIATTPR